METDRTTIHITVKDGNLDVHICNSPSQTDAVKASDSTSEAFTVSDTLTSESEEDPEVIKIVVTEENDPIEDDESVKFKDYYGLYPPSESRITEQVLIGIFAGYFTQHIDFVAVFGILIGGVTT